MNVLSRKPHDRTIRLQQEISTLIASIVTSTLEGERQQPCIAGDASGRTTDRH